MTLKEEHKIFLLAFFILVGFCVLSYFFLTRPGFYEFDSYYYLSLACGVPDYGNGNADGVNWAELLPCNIPFLKVGLLFLYAIALICVFLIGKALLNDTLSGLLLVISTGVTPTLMYSIVKLENDAIGITLSFLSLLYFFYYKKTQKKLFLGYAITFFLIAFLFWKGAGLVLIAFIADFLSWPLAILLSLAFLATFFYPQEASENQFVWGLCFFYVYSMFFKLKELLIIKKHKWAIPFFIIGIMNAKFFFYNLFFLGTLAIKQVDSKKVAFFIGGLLIWAATYGNIQWVESKPTEMEKQAAKDIVKMAIDFNKPISNDFGYGHLIFYYGGKTNDVFGVNHSKNFFALKNQLVLTTMDLNCPIMRIYDTQLIGTDLKIYNC